MFADVLGYRKPSEEGEHAREMRITREAGEVLPFPILPCRPDLSSSVLPGGGGLPPQAEPRASLDISGGVCK